MVVVHTMDDDVISFHPNNAQARERTTLSAEVPGPNVPPSLPYHHGMTPQEYDYSMATIQT